MTRLLFVTFIALSSQLTAATYFTRTDGNDSCDGTVDAAGTLGNCAKRTIQAAVNLAQAGDTVIVHAGTYTSASPIFSSVRHGSAGNLITVKGADGETVTVTRIKTSHDYHVVQNFRVTNSGAFDRAGIAVSGDHSQVISNTIIGNCQPWVGGEGCNTGLYSGGDYNVLSYNTLHGTNNSTNSFGIGFYIHSSTSTNTISHNLLTGINTPGRLFEVYGTLHTISDNEVANCRNDYGNNKVHMDVLQMFNSSSSYVTWERNYIHDFAGQFVLFSDWQVPGAIHHWTFRNNVYANVGGSAFIRSKHIYFYNNTFYRVGFNSQNAVLFRIDANGDGSFGQFRNNILIGNEATNLNLGMVQIISATTTIDHNYFATPSYGARTNLPGTDNVNGGDPQFVAAYTDCTANTCDFRISSNSAVEDLGASLAAVPQDKDLVPRPQGVAKDMGAYEYLAGGIAPSKAHPPSNLSAIVQ